MNNANASSWAAFSASRLRSAEAANQRGEIAIIAKPAPVKLHRRSQRKGVSRKAVYESLGMVQVRGARGGVCYE